MNTITCRFSSLIGCLCLLCSSTTFAQSWTTAKNKNGVKVETRFIKGWNLKEFRATTTVQTTLSKAVNAYVDPAQRKKFMTNAEVSNLKVISPDHFICYYRGYAPWPAADRDDISRSKVYRSNQQVKITSESLPDYIPNKDGVIRIPRSKGFWLFKDLGNGNVQITQQSVADLGGSIPDWLVNSAIVDAPFNMLSGMRKILE